MEKERAGGRAGLRGGKIRRKEEWNEGETEEKRDIERERGKEHWDID